MIPLKEWCEKHNVKSVRTAVDKATKGTLPAELKPYEIVSTRKVRVFGYMIDENVDPKEYGLKVKGK